MASQAQARARFKRPNRGVSVGSSSSSSGGSGGGGSSGSSSSVSGGYEVIRDGQGMSVQTIQSGDIVIKQVSGGGSSSGSGGTYYAGSGTYVNAQGQGMSVTQAPEGAKIIQGKDPNIPSSVSVSNQQSQIQNIAQQRAIIEARQRQLQQQYDRTINKRQARFVFERKQNKIDKQIADYNKRLQNYNQRLEQQQKNFQNAIKQSQSSTTYNLTGSAKKQLNQLEKERDKIYEKINTLNDKYGSGELTEAQWNRYQSKLAPIVGEWRAYNSAKNEILKDIPDKYIKAEIVYDPVTGEKVLTASRKDTTIGNRINEAINKLTTSARTGRSSIKGELALTGLVLAKTGIDTVKGFAQLPSTVKEVIKNPSVLKELPPPLKAEGKAIGKLLYISPTAGLAKLGAEVYLWTKGPGQALKITKKVGLRVGTATKLFKEVKKTSLGVQEIEKVKGVGNIEITLNRGEKLKVNPKRVIKEASLEIENKLKTKPSLPPTSNIEKKFLNIVKKRGDIVTGSYARETLLKKEFSRIHKDLDIASKNIPALKDALKKTFGKDVVFIKKPNSILVKIKGKIIADLILYKKAEGGFIKKYGYKKINGLNIANPRAIIGGKSIKLSTIKVPRSLKKSFIREGIKKTTKKTLKDIEKLTGKKALDRPALTGAFGFTKKEMNKYIGKSGPLTTAQAKFLVKKIFRKVPELKNKRWLYATPWELKTGKAQVRVSRLGLNTKEGSLLDLIRGKASLRNLNKPQLFVMPKEKIFKASSKLTKKKTIKTSKGFVVPNFTSELEVVLGKGYALKRGKILNRVRIGDNLVPIVELKKIRMPKTVRNELRNYNKLQDKLKSISGKKKPKSKSSIKRIITLYHGTDIKSAKSIMKKGFNKGSYLSDNFNTVLDYVGEAKAGRGSTVLKIKIPKSEFKKIIQKKIGRGNNKIKINKQLKGKIKVEEVFPPEGFYRGDKYSSPSKSSLSEYKNFEKKFKKSKNKFKLKQAEIKELIKKIDAKEKALNSKMKKLTGFDYFSRKIKPTKRYPLGKRGLSFITKFGKISRKIKPTKKIRPTPRPIKKPPIRPTPRPIKKPPIRPTPRPIKKPPIRPTPRPIKKPPIRSTPKPIKKPPIRSTPKPIKKPPIRPFPVGTKSRRLKRTTKKQKLFDVYARPVKGKKFRKINFQSLTKSRANDYGAFAVDNSLSRTFKVVRKGSKVKNATTKPVNKPLNVPVGYYSRSKPKFRNYRIIKGKRKLIQSQIEKTKHLLDTSREKRKITLAKLLSEGRRQIKKSKIKINNSNRRLSNSQLYKIRLQNLAKARAVRSRNIPIRRNVQRIKRKPSPAQLRALARGRAKLRRMRR